MRSIARYGVDAQTIVCMEISKPQRFDPENRTEPIENLYEEMADLLFEIYGLKPSIMWRMRQKMERF